MASTRATLSQLVDLALGTPEVGAVNFNVIHTILQTVVSKAGLANLIVEHRGELPHFEGSALPLVLPPEAPPPPADQPAQEGVAEPSESFVDRLNEVLQAQAQLKLDVEELIGRVDHLETIVATNQGDMEELRSQNTSGQNKLSADTDMYETNFSINERIKKLESDLTTQNDRLVDLHGILTGQINELSIQVEEIEKDMGIVNERLNIQSQTFLGPVASSSQETAQISPAGGSRSTLLMEGGHVVADLYAKVKGMQEDMEQLVQTSALLAEEKENLELRFDSLKEELEVVKTIKADKMEMDDILTSKADVSQVTRKVSHSDFLSRIEEVNLTLHEAFNTLKEHETGFQAEREVLQKEIESKMDKSEMIPIKDYLTENVKFLLEKVKILSTMRSIDDAAGAKRKVIKDLKCISCDKEVVMKQQLDSDDMKVAEGVKAHQSIKPFLTYKLDQVRKQQHKLPIGRNLLQFEEMMQSVDPSYKKPLSPLPVVQVDSALHICNRYCGGSHTITTPVQRITRTGHFFNEFGPPVPESPRSPETDPEKGIPSPPEPLTQQVQ